MMPFLDISSLSDEELETKTAALAHRIHIAQRANSQSYRQLIQMLQTLNQERMVRFEKRQADLNPKMKPGLVMTTDENVQPENGDENNDNDLINIQ